jgi:hypothetical protein
MALFVTSRCKLRVAIPSGTLERLQTMMEELRKRVLFSKNGQEAHISDLNRQLKKNKAGKQRLLNANGTIENDEFTSTRRHGGMR